MSRSALMSRSVLTHWAVMHWALSLWWSVKSLLRCHIKAINISRYNNLLYLSLRIELSCIVSLHKYLNRSNHILWMLLFYYEIYLWSQITLSFFSTCCCLSKIVYCACFWKVILLYFTRIFVATANHWKIPGCSKIQDVKN